MLMLIEENGNNSPNKFVNNKEIKRTKSELEQFSQRLSTALQRNRNLHSASHKLFTKVRRESRRYDDTFTKEILTATPKYSPPAVRRLHGSINEDVLHEPAQNKDSWSLNECLNEIQSISYDNFINASNGKTEVSESPTLYLLQQGNPKESVPAKPWRPSSITAIPKSERSVSTLSLEEELLFDESESVGGSSRSSISWASDAVEATLTLQLARLWEDVELVCSGQSGGKPTEMSDSVYEECLLWKRGFPEKSEHPSRFSTMAVASEEEEDSDSTPTPTNSNQMFGYDSPLVSANHRPSSLKKYHKGSECCDSDSHEQNCVTPNPNNSSKYVAAWLTDCQPHNQAEALGSESSDHQIPNQAYEFTLLSHSVISHRRKDSVISGSRPLSCSIAGHLITPFSTGNYSFPNRKNSGESNQSKHSPQHAGHLNLPFGARFASGTHSNFPMSQSSTDEFNLGKKVDDRNNPMISKHLQDKNPGKSNNFAFSGSSTIAPQYTGSMLNTSYSEYLSASTVSRQRPIRKSHNMDEFGSPKKTPFLLWLLDSTN